MFFDSDGLRTRSNPWNNFQSNNKGKYNQSQMSQAYRDQQNRALAEGNKELRDSLSNLPDKTEEALNRTGKCPSVGPCTYQVEVCECFHSDGDSGGAFCPIPGDSKIRPPPNQDPTCICKNEYRFMR